jgi:branched-chain amino acid transport system ATP-binding protein
MLRVENLHAGYGRARILQGVDLALAAGEVLVLLGRNGAGKSTTLKSLIGLVRPAAGRIVFAGNDIAGWEPHRIAQAGLGYVPEERRIFTDLTLLENLEVGRQPPRDGRAPWTERRLFALFPNLGELRHRPGGRMSGGEQQMLTIARTLMGNPRLILLDEPSEGLAPVIVEQMANAITAMKAQGVTILLAEQNLHFATRVADRVAVIETGRITWRGPMCDARDGSLAEHLGLSGQGRSIS